MPLPFILIGAAAAATAIGAKKLMMGTRIKILQMILLNAQKI
jgi:hypothetical protein